MEFKTPEYLPILEVPRLIQGYLTNIDYVGKRSKCWYFEVYDTTSGKESMYHLPKVIGNEIREYLGEYITITKQDGKIGIYVGESLGDNIIDNEESGESINDSS